MLQGDTFRAALDSTAKRPFRSFHSLIRARGAALDGGKVCDLPDGPPNYAWCFDCVPEENSLRLAFGSCIVEVPAIDLVFFRPKALLGDHVFRALAQNFPSASIFSTPWAAAICRSRSIL